MKAFIAILIVIILAVFIFIFGPVIKQEITFTFIQASGVKYSINATDAWTFQRPVYIPNIDFSIIIPKIDASAPIIDNVDLTNQEGYLKALKSGVAHENGTPYPGDPGNVFLFAHASDNIYNISRYNTTFFLLGHLSSGDDIDVYYKGRLYKYIVFDKKTLDPADTQYLTNVEVGDKTLTLQTGYPAGTFFKKLILVAKLDESNQ